VELTTLSSVQAKTAWSYPTAPPYAGMTCWIISLTDNFIFPRLQILGRFHPFTGHEGHEGE